MSQPAPQPTITAEYADADGDMLRIGVPAFPASGGPCVSIYTPEEPFHLPVDQVPAVIADLRRLAAAASGSSTTAPQQPEPYLPADPWQTVARLTAWLDDRNGRSGTETALRILKVTEEAGEVASAWIGMTGQNPRKGVTHVTADVADELCDVITAAMVALTTISGDPAGHFTRKIAQIAALRLDDAQAAGGERP